MRERMGWRREGFPAEIRRNFSGENMANPSSGLIITLCILTSSPSDASSVLASRQMKLIVPSTRSPFDDSVCAVCVCQTGGRS